jgi:hypothetical protein
VVISDKIFFSSTKITIKTFGGDRSLYWNNFDELLLLNECIQQIHHHYFMEIFIILQKYHSIFINTLLKCEPLVIYAIERWWAFFKNRSVLKAYIYSGKVSETCILSLNRHKNVSVFHALDSHFYYYSWIEYRTTNYGLPIQSNELFTSTISTWTI